MLPSVDNPLRQPYAAFNQPELLTILIENLVGQYLGGKAISAISAAERAHAEAAARGEVRQAVAEYCGAQPNAGVGHPDLRHAEHPLGLMHAALLVLALAAVGSGDDADTESARPAGRARPRGAREAALEAHRCRGPRGLQRPHRGAPAASGHLRHTGLAAAADRLAAARGRLHRLRRHSHGERRSVGRQRRGRARRERRARCCMRRTRLR